MLFLVTYLVVALVLSVSYLDWIVIIYYVLILFCIVFNVSKNDVTVYFCFHNFFSDIEGEFVGSSWM